MARRLPLAAITAIALMMLFAGPGAAVQAPSQQDPCAQAGRDTCDTTGVGAYHSTAYGLRWFGDYRGAVAGFSGAFFCIDLNFWFPGRSYDYQLHSTVNLRSRLGAAVSSTMLHRLAYAVWNYGRSTSAAQQAAVMLYVHEQVGVADPAAVAPNVIGGAVAALNQRIAAAAAKYAGPYTIKAKLASTATAGFATPVTLQVIAASGAAVPGVTFQLSVTGASGAPQTVTSNGSGTSSFNLTPNDAAGGLHVRATATGLASDLPLLYVPTHGAARSNGQRLITSASQTLSTSAEATISLVKPTISSQAAPATLAVGATDTDHVTLAGLPSGAQTNVQVNLYGPAASQSAISCSGSPAATVSYTAGNGQSTAPPVTPAGPGWYGYQVSVPASDTVAATTSACAPTSESFEVTTTPQVHTQISAASLAPGSSLYDTVVVSGLYGQSATVSARLYGPYPTAAAINCQGNPTWTGQVPVSGDGTYRTAATTLQTPGYYVYVEAIAAQGVVQAASTSCSDTAETTIVQGSPTVTTQVSNAQATAGGKLQDHAIVSGLGALQATVDVTLWGPYPSQAAVDCTGKPAWTGSFTAHGDGTYLTATAKLPAAGYYVYQESIAASDAYAGVQTQCAESAETTVARATPQLGTVASAQAVHPGSQVFDTIKVSGLGQTAATIHAELFGPFAAASQISCSGHAVWSGTVQASGDDTVKTAPTTIGKVGFYVYRESMDATAFSPAVQTSCASVPETVLGTPMIITGPGAPQLRVAAAAASHPLAATPASVSIAGVLSAPIDAAGIDTHNGDLGVPSNIHRVGWWRDGAAPGDSQGTVLLAGHINWAGEGPGAFYPLAFSVMGGPSMIGKIVTVQTHSGATYRYRITTAFKVPKAQLPPSVYDRLGARKLVMVTCGGPYDAQTRHYVDNVVVVATPV